MVFNAKKQAQGFMDTMVQDALSMPPGVNPVAAQYLWNTIYKNDPNVATIQDMVNILGGPEAVEREYGQWSDPDQVADAQQPAAAMQSVTQQLDSVMGNNKSFNLKTARTKVAQEVMPPMDPMGLNDSPELMGDPLQQQDEFQQDQIPQPPFQKMEDFKKWIDNTDNMTVLQAITTPEGDGIKQQMEQYFTSQDEGEKGTIAAAIFSDPSFPLRETGGFMAQKEHFGEINNIIEKIAKKTAKSNKPTGFNLKKTAQHKTMDNAIMWGPGQTQIDPFLHQPVSDWHIVERNKGFGLVVDDVWNIDYETIWRENIMDKYSRPYKNKDGDWVGGYLNKRFEIDRNIPPENNMQLKPGQLRKPILPEYGNTESRLQSARAAGEIEGAIDKSKPVNWKEASKKKS